MAFNGNTEGGDVRFLLMLVGPDYDPGDRTDEQIESDIEAHLIFHRILKAKRIPWSGEGLREPSTATTLRRDPNGDFLITRGPYARISEYLGGYYVIDVKGLDEALEIAKLCPLAGGEAIEIRPIYEPE